MENLILTEENIVCHLRKNRWNKRNLQIIKLLENVQKLDCESKHQWYKVLEELLQILKSCKVNTHESTNGDIIFSCAILLTCLQEQHKLPYLNEAQFADLWQWLLEQYKSNENNTLNICRIIIAMGNLLALHAENVDKYFVFLVQTLMQHFSSNSADVLLITTLQCLNKILNVLKDVKLSDEQGASCADVGGKLLQLHYGEVEGKHDRANITVIILYSLEILHKIVVLNADFAKLQTAELLGLSKTYFHLGLDASEMSALLKPQKVHVSQQALYDSAEEIETVINSQKAHSCGGKTPKTRKPRAVVKNTRSNECKAINRSLEIGSGPLVFDMKTSDSDMSEPENATNRILFERSRNAKIRMAAIHLVGSIARIVERRTLFGYWHALFPSGTADSIDNLLYIGQHDPNVRCRSAALQVCSLLLYGSKGYLHQAEINVKRCPTTFIPFSVSLGYTVLAIYKSLATILTSESSLPVLTQALKCLAVLVQSSPFKQFEKGFVQNFVKDVKPLVYHRDAAVQVSALMVMEFLVALQETCSDIAVAVGMPQSTMMSAKTNKQLVDDEEIDIVDIEEFVDSEEENFVHHCDERMRSNEFPDNHQILQQTSWLLTRVLHNLSEQEILIVTSVRIESLQVLNVLTSNFPMIKPHLTKIAEVLLYSLKDSLPDVRLYAARCVDACAYQINRYLLENGAVNEYDLKECNRFWLTIMPFIMTHIHRDSEEMTTVRITLCDAVSNIGGLLFEYTPHARQISLLSFLSGVSGDSSEEAIVRAAAARALAVYALYPSLRSDLVFIENTAELTLSLVKDGNILVRVKSFWSLGNISDALIGKGSEVAQLRQERISNDLLFRLITAATAACSDNDKVRCNAVRTLGNLLRLLNEEHLANVNSKLNWRDLFAKAVCKLSDCLRSAGNAKVKWNTCYAITNLMRNPIIYKVSDVNWQTTLFTSLCHVIVHHANFKVRINASAAITNIVERAHFGSHYEKFLSSVLEAIEQSYNLDNFHEYNHRDSLQEHLCLALSHIIGVGVNEDLPLLKKHVVPRSEVIRHTWQRVINRMVPEKAAPLLACPVVLLERARRSEEFLSLEQKKILDFLIEIFSAE